jgi:2-keto-4-pentenoate hydratase/2-oxohepta-3-ene-1,7-dioic acid hydratase in catechol pathway
MKLVTYTTAAHPEPARIGALVNKQTRIVDLQAAAATLSIGVDGALDDMISLIARGAEGRALVGDILQRSAEVPSAMISIDDVHLRSPVPVPNSIRDCMEFEQHLVQCMRMVVRRRCRPLFWLDRISQRCFGSGIIRVPAVWHERPVYYKGNRRTVVGTGHAIQWPDYTEQLDFELEFGVFVGVGGRNIDVAAAPHHIAGYAMFNDFSARDTQLREMQGKLGPAKGKDFETGNVIGPWLTTPDEVDAGNLSLEVRVNGQTWSRAETAEMKFSFAELIAYISREEALYPGDFIGSGTLPGGCGLELDRWIQPGDEVELAGGVLGTLRNRVIREGLEARF